MTRIAPYLIAALALSLSAGTNPFDPVQRGLGGGILGAASGLLMDYMGVGVLAISAGLSLSALFALLLLKARPAAAPVPA